MHDAVTLRPGTVVPMPTSPRAEQSRTRGPVPGMPPARKITAGHCAQASAKRTVQAVAWPYGPAFEPCPPAVAYFEVSKVRPAARAAKADEASSSWSHVRRRRPAAPLCSDPAITIQRHWRQFPARMAGFGTTFSEAARQP